MLTIQIPQSLENQLTQLATQHNLPLETFILQTLQRLTEPDPDSTPNAEILAGLYRALEDVKAGRVSPVETLWEDTDD